MQTLEQLFDEYDKQKAEYKEETKALEELATKQAEAAAAAEDAAEAGQVAEYKKLKKQADDLAAEHYVRSKQLAKKITKPTEKEAAKIWENYRQKFTAERDKMLAEYYEARHKAAEKYRALMMKEGQGYTARERLGEITEHAPGVYGMNWLTLGQLSEERRFFKNNNEITQAEATLHTSMLIFNRL